MRYLRLYEEFINQSEVEINTKKEQEISNKTIDDVLKDDFFDDIKDEEDYNKDIVQIKNWKIY